MLELDANNELNTQIQYRLIEKLTQSERRYRELVENLREIVFECDHNGTLTFLNRAWEETLGYPTDFAMGKVLDDFIHPSNVEQWQSTLKTKMDANIVLKFVHQSGQCLWLELSMQMSSNTDLSGSLIDITERRQAAKILQQANEVLEDRVKQRTEELSQANHNLTEALQQLQCTQGQLIQTEKMSSLGQLVAGIAHEINNPVNFVYGNLEPTRDYVQKILKVLDLYQHHYPAPDPTIQTELEELDINFVKTDFPKLLESMRMGTKRIQDIVISLRNFSRLDEASIKTVNIHEGIDNTLLILNSRLQNRPQGPDIQIVKTYGPVPLVECFPGELNQVFMNILTNALDALEELPIREEGTSDALLEDSSVQHAVGKTAPTISIKTNTCGDRTLVSIADNGSGIPATDIPKLFDPFFTTKPVGKGTGLGLSISHKIITERHKGSLKCYSTVGEGSTFVIEIPCNLSP